MNLITALLAGAIILVTRHRFSLLTLRRDHEDTVGIASIVALVLLAVWF